MKIAITFGGLICFLSVIITATARNVYLERGTYNMFEDFLEKFKEVLRTGNDTFGIPVLDPFTADELPIAIDEDFLKLDGLLTNVRLEGLSGYDVNSGDFKIAGLKLTMDLSWPSIVASTNYSINGNASNFQIYGHGEMKAAARDFSFEGEVVFGINGEYLKVKSVGMKISLREFEFHATGIYDDDELSELLSAIISDMVPQLIQDYHDTITEIAGLLVIDKLNEFLSTMTLVELLKLIGL
ncbi:uncharacterized protein LOC114938879 [Nylanderia fulva]|uniref:uncharacterized protein LOC114938879 n=1 Tax=Nylanderia fulva TaxID=613905 RepID=UPI0010FB5BB1|nr:uncharacterized protein LOC114938879 [Nylanderia fulva]XP_029168832.1 uncharacterized protein LOC114938879 [Nylanderia fulva]